MQSVKIKPEPVECPARSVRNWFIRVAVDGRAHVVATGPKNKQGGFVLDVLQRERGGAVRVLNIEGFANVDERGRGSLVLRVDGQEVYRSER